MQANVDVSRLPMNFRAILNVLRWDNLTKKEEPLSGESYILYKETFEINVYMFNIAWALVNFIY